MEKPKFGIIEQAKAILLSDIKLYRILLYTIMHPERRHDNGWNFVNQAKFVKMRLNHAMLEERIPIRDQDKKINWPNYFAIQMQLDRPVKRDDIFPDGTEGLSENEIMKKAHEFLRPLSSKFNFCAATTEFDPVEFPEIIDIDYRDTAQKINNLIFCRTASGCSGHGDRPNAYCGSNLFIRLDWLDHSSVAFFNKITQFCRKFSQNNIHAQAVFFERDDKDIGEVKITLNMDTPKESEDKKSTQQSEINKKIRDEFWEGIGKIAEDIKAQ